MASGDPSPATRTAALLCTESMPDESEDEPEFVKAVTWEERDAALRAKAINLISPTPSADACAPLPVSRCFPDDAHRN